MPGLVLTQHSGSGKANQFFLRGFNLDHGTDFATFVDGMPVNLPTHGHGHGYTDLHFPIPGLVSGIHYRIDPYYADAGDFSAAGAARIGLLGALPHTVAELTIGHRGYQRGLLAASTVAASGTLLVTVDAQFSNDPWDLPENSNRYTGLVRYGHGTEGDGWLVTAMPYRNAPSPPAWSRASVRSTTATAGARTATACPAAGSMQPTRPRRTSAPV